MVCCPELFVSRPAGSIDCLQTAVSRACSPAVSLQTSRHGRPPPGQELLLCLRLRAGPHLPTDPELLNVQEFEHSQYRDWMEDNWREVVTWASCVYLIIILGGQTIMANRSGLLINKLDFIEKRDLTISKPVPCFA